MQKKAPYEVWRVELTAIPDLLAQGRKKYERLLRAHATQQCLTVAARPRWTNLSN